MKAFEMNFDGLVGPTHCYAGLSFGNIASVSHKAAVSNPQEAALQGLAKAKALADLGFQQGILAPQERPDMAALRALGFTGSDAAMLEHAFRVSPEILAACASASSMWTANAATVSPSADSADGKVHFTAANLNQKFHRTIESATTTRLLKAMFADDTRFVHHEALISSDTFGDEGAANHTRFCNGYGDKGLQFFVYGRRALDSSTSAVRPRVFPARQTLEASEAVARLHQLAAAGAMFVQQNPECIDGGAFHNDVVAVGNQNVLFYHEKAFCDSAAVIARLQKTFEQLCGGSFYAVMVPDRTVPLADAVKSYLFNSQLVSMPDGSMTLIAPSDCEETPSVRDFLAVFLARAQTPIRQVRYFNLKQSMRNGGGPACLRLRVVLNEVELRAVNPGAVLTEGNYLALRSWVMKHYRDRLEPRDLADPQLLVESRTALDQLTQIMRLGSVYPFQM